MSSSVYIEPLPPMETVLGALDNSARKTATKARDTGLSAVRRQLPARTRNLQRGTRGRVTRSRTGYVITVAPGATPRYPNGVTPREVWRFVSEGTGVHGKRGRPITRRGGRPFHLPHGWAGSIDGQRPQHLTERAHSAGDAVVYRELEGGAVDAARAMERALD